MLNIGLGLLCLVFGAAAFIRSHKVFMARLDERRAVARLYALTREQTTRRAFHA